MAPRKRAVRRAEDRAQEKLARDLSKLADLAPGGGPSRPIMVTSPAEVEVTAAGMLCPICRSSVRVDEHAAEVFGGVRLRVARVTCTFCRAKRAIYFQLASTMAN